MFGQFAVADTSLSICLELAKDASITYSLERTAIRCCLHCCFCQLLFAHKSLHSVLQLFIVVAFHEHLTAQSQTFMSSASVVQGC